MFHHVLFVDRFDLWPLLQDSTFMLHKGVGARNACDQTVFSSPPFFFYKLVESLFHPNESNSPLLLVTLHFSHYSRLSFQGISNPELHLQHSSQRGRLNTQCWFLQILQFDDSLNQWCVREGVSACVPMVSAAGYNVSSTWNVTLTRLSASGSTVVCKSSGEQFAQSQNHTYLILHPPPTRWDPLVLIWSCWQGGQWLVGEEKKKNNSIETHTCTGFLHTQAHLQMPLSISHAHTHTHTFTVHRYRHDTHASCVWLPVSDTFNIFNIHWVFC